MYTNANRAKIVHEEAKRLEQFLSTLSLEDWQRPSQCDQWQVADVVAHLVGVQHAERITRGLHGDLTPPAGFVPSGALNEDDLRDHMSQGAIALRSQSSDQLLEAFRAEREQLDEVLAGVAPQDWEKLCYHPVGPEPIRTIIDIRLTELAMHGWDIRASFDPQASLFVDSIPALVNTIPRASHAVIRVLRQTSRHSTGTLRCISCPTIDCHTYRLAVTTSAPAYGMVYAVPHVHS